MPFPKKFTKFEKKVTKPHPEDAKSMDEYVTKKNVKKRKMAGY